MHNVLEKWKPIWEGLRASLSGLHLSVPYHTVPSAGHCWKCLLIAESLKENTFNSVSQYIESLL